MSSAAELFEQVMALPPDVREAMALRILSATAPFVPLEEEAHWSALLGRRRQELRSGLATIDDVEAVMAAAQAAIRARR